MHAGMCAMASFYRAMLSCSAQSRKNLKSHPVYFSLAERTKLFSALVAACSEFDYRLSDVTVEVWHLHWIMFHGNHAIEAVMGRLKTRMRQALGRGKIWTEGYCAEPLLDQAAIEQAQEYIARHDGCMMLDGRVIGRETPGRAGGYRSNATQ